MLIDTRTHEQESSKSGFNPNVQNNQYPATSTGAGKLGFIILSILTIGIFAICIYVGKGNWFNRAQIKANEAASNIDIQLKKRRDTLVKLVDASKSSMKFEKDLLENVTKLRTASNFNPMQKGQDATNRLESTFSKVMATFENYPKLESVAAIRDLMASADYSEREIAASRRTYNAVVNEFNQELYVWPNNIVAAHKKLYNLPLFVASDEDKKDVKLDLNV